MVNMWKMISKSLFAPVEVEVEQKIDCALQLVNHATSSPSPSSFTLLVTESSMPTQVTRQPSLTMTNSSRMHLSLSSKSKACS